MHDRSNVATCFLRAAFGLPFVAVASRGLDGRSVGGTAFPYRWAQGTGRGRPARPCKHESARKLRGRGYRKYPLPLSISGMTFGRKRKLNKEKESGRKAQRVAGVIVFSAQIR